MIAIGTSGRLLLGAVILIGLAPPAPGDLRPDRPRIDRSEGNGTGDCDTLFHYQPNDGFCHGRSVPEYHSSCRSSAGEPLAKDRYTGDPRVRPQLCGSRASEATSALGGSLP